MSDGPFYSATHAPNEILWRPVTRKKRVRTDHGDVIARPGEHVEVLDPGTGVAWVIRAIDFARRYGKSLVGKARDVFEQYYPGVL